MLLLLLILFFLSRAFSRAFVARDVTAADAAAYSAFSPYCRFSLFCYSLLFLRVCGTCRVYARCYRVVITMFIPYSAKRSIEIDHAMFE